jgi:hypothetical protein
VRYVRLREGGLPASDIPRLPDFRVHPDCLIVDHRLLDRRHFGIVKYMSGCSHAKKRLACYRALYFRVSRQGVAIFDEHPSPPGALSGTDTRIACNRSRRHFKAMRHPISCVP